MDTRQMSRWLDRLGPPIPIWVLLFLALLLLVNPPLWASCATAVLIVVASLVDKHRNAERE